MFTRPGPADVGTFGWITLGATAAALGLVGALHVFSFRQASATQRWVMRPVSRGILYAAIVVLVTLFSNGGAQQFIYFQF